MRRSIQGMLEELEYNLWEHILMRLVDYGHAFSPEMEMAAMHGDTAGLLHGEAVNCDMALTTQVLRPPLARSPVPNLTSPAFCQVCSHVLCDFRLAC